MSHFNARWLGAGLLLLSACTAVENRGAGVKAIDVANIDTSIVPCDDFDAYANGGWQKAHPLPATEASYGAFNELNDRNESMLREILEKAAKSNAAKGTNTQRVGDFYASGMDSAAIEAAGLTPVQPLLAKIDGAKSPAEFLTVVTELERQGIANMIGVYVGQDSKDVSKYAMNLGQSGLGLGNPEYYTGTGAYEQDIRSKYQAYVEKVLGLMGMDAAAAKKGAADILALEVALAKVSRKYVDLRNPQLNYNKMTLAELAKLTPDMDWAGYFKGIGAKQVEYVIVGQPDYYKGLNGLLKSTPLDTWKLYQKFHTVRSLSNYLSMPFVTASFDFFGKTLRGAKEMQPRWKRILRQTNNSLGEALGQEYVQQAFTPQAKERCLEMVRNLQQAFSERIAGLEWMGDSTKVKAQEKLQAIVNKIGYPDKWKDYSSLSISRESYVQNVMAANVFSHNENIGRLGQPIDRGEWLMSPQMVNAYYNPVMNEIAFPAGILQPPFFDPNADDAVNYGGMGAVIGHELTHGFDDQGRQYDASGNLREWWTPEDDKKFRERAGVVVDQFNGYTVVNDSTHVNGQLTLGENIADLGGLTLAYYAFMKTEQAKKGEKIDGFTPQQRFFLGWAQVWRSNASSAYLQNQVKNDPHSPAKYRINGPLSNMPEFKEAFQCQDGSRMVRPAEKQARIW